LARFIPRQGNGTIFVGVQGAAQRVKGLDKLQARLASLPDAMVARVRDALSQGVDDMVDEMKAIAPSSDLEPHPGALREAIEKQDGRHDLSFDVTCNPEDAKGGHYGAHVEFGHKTKDGKHVPAKPFFFTVYHHQQKKLRARVSRASSTAIKDLYK
jgi:HK97 gp10 family phage protein